MYILGQVLLYLCMKPHHVADMREVCPLGAHLPDEFQRFLKVEVGMMGFLPQCIDYKYFYPFQTLHFGRVYGFNVCEVCKIANAVSENLQAVVTGINGHDPMWPQLERLPFLHRVHHNCRGPGIAVFVGKDVVEAPAQGVGHSRVGIDGDIALPEKERPDIVNTGRMVGVFVGKEDAVEPLHIVPQHLLPEIGAAIDHVYTVIFGFDHDRYPQPLVAGVGAQANRMFAADYRDALRGSGTEESDLQQLVRFRQIYN